jgi:hypothetical protein
VNDSAVVSALVASDAIFFLEQQETQARETSRDFERHAKTDGSSTDDDDAVAGIGHVDIARERVAST